MEPTVGYTPYRKTRDEGRSGSLEILQEASRVGAPGVDSQNEAYLGGNPHSNYHVASHPPDRTQQFQANYPPKYVK